MNKLAMFVLVAALAVGAGACKKETAAEKAERETKEAIGAIGDAFKDAKNDASKELEKARKALQDKIEDVDDELKKQKEALADASGDSKEAIQKKIAELEAQRKKLEADLKK